MAVPASVDEFLDLVRKSGVADEKKLDAYLAKMRADMPADAAKAAGLMVHNAILTNFQAENILAGKWRRFSIGKYKVLERLGSGGFAQVYLCEHKLMRRRVAVKVLPVAKSKDSSALERFYREARAVAALDHPNIVHAYDIDQDDDLHFLVMEYVDGANLQEIVKRTGPLSVLRACHYIWYSAMALQHAHEHGLIHRDIKPGNILVDRTGSVKVLDMGLALFFLEEDEQLTKKHDDGTLGTADYLSPEQAMDSHDVDIRTDIYSLGVTFYFMLTGRAPFEGLPIAQKLLAHHMKQPKPASDYRKDIPPGVLAILDKMMAKKAELRYSVPGDLADALAPFVQEPIGPPVDAEMPRLSPAATGQPIASDAETAVGKNDTPVTSPRSKPPSDSKKKGPVTTPSPAVDSGRAKAAVTVQPAATLAPASEPEEAPWNPLPTEGSGTVKEHTDYDSARVRKTPSAPKNYTTLLLVMGFVVIPIFLTAVIAGVIWYLSPPPLSVVKAGPIHIEVSRDQSRKNASRSIQSALRKAELGSVIELWDDTYEENVLIDPSIGPTGITIQAAPGKAIVWRPARNDANKSILSLRKAIHFKLKGKGITFDGELDKNSNVKDLITIMLDGTGIEIEDIHCKNFGRSALFFTNATGSDSQPIKIQRLTAETSDKSRAAIYFDADQKFLPPYNDHIEIEGSDAKAIQFRQIPDKTVFGKNVRWPGKS